MSEEGLVCTGPEATADAADGAVAPRAATDSPGGQAQAGGSPAPGSAQAGPVEALTRAEWEARGYDPALAGFLEEAGVDPGLIAADAPVTLEGLLASTESSPFGRPTRMVRRLAAKFVATQALLACGAGEVAPPAKRRLELRSPTAGVTPAAGEVDRVTAVTGSALQLVLPAATGALNATCNLEGPDSGQAMEASPRVTAQAVELAEKRKQATLLAACIGEAQVAAACGCRLETWQKMPAERQQETWLRHATSYSAGRLAGVRRALQRLAAWLQANDLRKECEGFKCEGGVLSWWVQDEQAKSRTAGLTVPASLRGALVSAHDNFGFTQLEVQDPAFKNVAALPGRTPTPAKSATTAMLLHFVRVAREHLSEIVRRYAAGFVLCMLSCMRIRDAQRAALAFGVSDACAIRGVCYTSKHPRRRQHKEMPVYVPPTDKLLGEWDASLRRAVAGQPDYTFPRLCIPRGKSIEHPGVVVLDGPAKSAFVIKAMRWVLAMDGYMTEAEAKHMTGHSLRHWLGTVARLLGYSEEDRSELGRWLASTTDGAARRGSMPNRYSNADAEEPRVLALVAKLLADTMARVRKAGGPSKLSKAAPWAVYTSDGVAVCDVRDDVDPEASSSESSDPGDED